MTFYPLIGSGTQESQKSLFPINVNSIKNVILKNYENAILISILEYME
jgi:hypothetical protein